METDKSSLMEINKSYELIRKKYALPKFEELDADFDIHCIEDGLFLVKEIRYKITEKVDEIAMMVEEIMQPDTKVSSLYESRIFSELDKENIFKIFRKLMKIKRKSMQLMLLNSEKEDAEFIKSTFSEWQELKKQLYPVLQKLIESWEDETNIKEHLSYFG